MKKKCFANYTEIEVDVFRETLILHMDNVKKYIEERAQHELKNDDKVNECRVQSSDSNVESGKALDAGTVIIECRGTETDNLYTNSSYVTLVTHDVDADIRHVNVQVSCAEVPLSIQQNVFANILKQTDQDDEHDYDKCSLAEAEPETKCSKSNDMVKKKIYDELSNRFLQLEKHCISLEIAIQNMEESLQSNKPCKNPEFPEFREFFEINTLKAQLQDKSSTIDNLQKHISVLNKKSNLVKAKHDIDVIKSRNVELELYVARLLKENETLKRHHIDLRDSIKETGTKTSEQTTSLRVKNDKFKSQIQEKGLYNCCS